MCKRAHVSLPAYYAYVIIKYIYEVGPNDAAGEG